MTLTECFFPTMSLSYCRLSLSLSVFYCHISSESSYLAFTTCNNNKSKACVAQTILLVVVLVYHGKRRPPSSPNPLLLLITPIIVECRAECLAYKCIMDPEV